MAINFKFLADMAALAEASYAKFTSFSDTGVQDMLEKGVGFSKTQATAFVQDCSIVAGSYQPDMASGFSATLFQGKAGSGDLAGQYVLAIRGTLGSTDLVGADGGDIVLDGLAVDQIIDLYNYTQKLTHTGTYQAATLTRVTITDGSLPEVYAKAHGLLFLKGFNNGDGAGVYQVGYETRNDGIGALPVGASVHVTGHSLGGHLAAAFSRMFPNITLDATMINGAGFANGFSLTSSSFNVDNLFQALGGANSFNPNKITNYIGTAAMDFVAQDWFINLEQPGGALHVTTESFSIPNTVGHGAGQMTNTLAVMSLFGQLSQTGTLTLAFMNDLMEKSANNKLETFERLVNDLSRTFGIAEIANVSADSTTVGREALFTNIVAIKNSPTFQSLAGKITLVASSTLAREARTDLGAFLSLLYLTPFAIKTDDAAVKNLLYTVHDPISSKWNDDRNLTAEQIANGEANFSDMWLADRAAMLSWQNRLNKKDIITSENQRPTQDSDGLTLGNNDAVDAELLYYQDKQTSTEIYLGDHFFGLYERPKVIFGSSESETGDTAINGGDKADHLYGMGGDDNLNGGDDNDYLEGNEGNDTLNGDAGNDTLLGGNGIDILDGGTGNDQLKGGTGHDIYNFIGQFGTDTITDTDGNGQIIISGQTLSTANFKLENIYKDDSSSYTFTRLNDGKSIAITKEDDSNRIIINDWSDTNNLSINLTGDMPTAPDATMTGDFSKKTNSGGMLEFEVIEAYANLITPQQLVGNYVADGVLANAQDNLQGNGIEWRMAA